VGGSGIMPQQASNSPPRVGVGSRRTARSSQVEETCADAGDGCQVAQRCGEARDGTKIYTTSLRETDRANFKRAGMRAVKSGSR